MFRKKGQHRLKLKIDKDRHLYRARTQVKAVFLQHKINSFKLIEKEDKQSYALISPRYVSKNGYEWDS